MGAFGKATGLTSSKQRPLSIQTSDGLELTRIDGDTWADNTGQSYRLAGTNLEETAKVIKDGKKRTFKEGHLGGQAATVAMHQLQTQGGFNILNDTGETDKYGRKVIRFTNEKGEDYSNTAHASGIAEVTQYTDEQALRSIDEAELEEELLGKSHEYNEIAEELKKERTPHKFKPKALNELQYSASPEYFDGVEFRHAGRTIDNKSLNPWSDSWESGWLGVKEGLYGFADLIGQGTGVEWLEDIGETGVASARQRLQNMGKVSNLDYKEIDSIWDGFQFVTNNAIMSAPYLAIGLGSALAAPFTLGASVPLGLSTLGGTYIGQFWNEMEGERGAEQMAAAIAGGTAAAALDRLGLKGIIKPSAFLTKSGQNRAQKALRDKIYGTYLKSGNKISLAQADRLAKEQIGDASKASILNSVNIIGKLTASDIAKQGVSGVAKQGARGFLSESITEAAQEGLQAATVATFSDTEYTRGEVLDRLINASLAGGTVGGGLSTAGAIKESATNEFLRRDLEHKNANLSALDALREADKEAGVTTKSVEDIRNETRDRRKNRQQDVDVGEEASYRKAAKERHQQNNRGVKNIFSNITDISTAFGTVWEGVNRLHRASLETAIPTAVALSSPAMRKLKALVGNGIIGGTYYDGKGEYAYRQSLISDIESWVNPDVIINNRLGIARGNRTSGQVQASKDLRDFISSGAFEAYSRYSRGEADLDLSKIPTRFHGKLEQLAQSVKDFEQGYATMFAMMQDIYKRETGNDIEPEAARQFADWFNFASPDRVKVKHNQRAFKKFLKDNSNMLDSEIDDIYNRIVNGEVNDGTQSLLDAEWRPWSSKLNAVSQAKGWDKFSNDNMFETFDLMKEKVARYTSNAEYFGEGGRNIDELLKEAEEEGIVSKDDIDRAAWHVSNIIDSSNHTYNRIENPRVAALVQMATSWSAFVGLGLSAISSLPETALIYENIENSVEMRNATMKLANEFISMFTTGMKNNYNYYYGKGSVEQPRSQQLLNKVGLPLSQTSAQQRLGVGSTSPGMQKWLNRWFKIIGIQGITGWQRRANASFAVDYINNRLESLSYVPLKKDGRLDLKQANRRQQQQYNDLVNLGVNVDKLVDLFNASSGDRSNFDILNEARDLTGLDAKLKIKRDGETDLIDEIDDQMQTAIYAFVNQRVQNPQAPNRPLIFQDPTLQIFTQFNGFISTFTAQAMPRIYGNRVLRGAPSTRANTAALIVAMIAMGGASQYLKDWIKFGGRTPYIKNDWRLFQRAVHASGVLGQGERVVDHFLPLYPQRDSGFDKLWNTIVGEAGPTARVATSLGAAADHITRGDTPRAVNQALKAVPIASLLPEERHALTDLLHGNIPKSYRN